VTFHVLAGGEVSKLVVPCKKGPRPLLGERQREAVGDRENPPLRAIAKGVRDTLLGHFLNAQAKLHQTRAPLAPHFLVIENIWHRELIWQRKHHLQEPAALRCAIQATEVTKHIAPWLARTSLPGA